MESSTTAELVERKHSLEQRLANLVYGSPEVRTRDHKKYLYVHHRLNGKQITTYVDAYSDDLFNLITKNNQLARELNRNLKVINHQLRELGYTEKSLPEKIKRNLDFAKRNLALTIHSQAILEGVATTFASTEDIIDGARVQGMSTQDVTKILNMKHAWEFILDDDIILSPQNLGLLMQINKLVEEGFYYNAGKIRNVPVRIGGTKWLPDLPIPSQIEEGLASILKSRKPSIDKAIDFILYIQRSQIFLDGNKRTAIIFANHFLISKGLGLIFIPEDLVEDYKKLLVKYYETGKKSPIAKFLKERCYLKI